MFFQDIEFICLVACLLNKNGHYAYNFIREICVKVSVKKRPVTVSVKATYDVFVGIGYVN